MAEHTRLHLWINTAIAGLAFAASAATAFNTWHSYSLNVESMGFTSNFTYDCYVGFGGRSKPDGTEQSEIGLCWHVIIANQSNTRISLVGTRAKSVSTVALLYNLDGEFAKLPINLDFGEARTFLAQSFVPIEEPMEKIFRNWLEDKGKLPGDEGKLADLAFAAGKEKLDVLGRHVDTFEIVNAITFKNSAGNNPIRVPLTLVTGRNNVFSTQLVFPSREEEFIMGPAGRNPKR